AAFGIEDRGDLGALLDGHRRVDETKELMGVAKRLGEARADVLVGRDVSLGSLLDDDVRREAIRGHGVGRGRRPAPRPLARLRKSRRLDAEMQHPERLEEAAFDELLPRAFDARRVLLRHRDLDDLAVAERAEDVVERPEPQERQRSAPGDSGEEGLLRDHRREAAVLRVVAASLLDLRDLRSPLAQGLLLSFRLHDLPFDLADLPVDEEPSEDHENREDSRRDEDVLLLASELLPQLLLARHEIHLARARAERLDGATERGS